MLRLLSIWDALRGSFWFPPALLATLAVGLAVGLLTLDSHLATEQIQGSRWFYSGGPEGARSLLSALAGSIITVVGLAFSITIVSLQLASAQLGPRLLRNFVRDLGNQVVLGVFVATFVYCLVVLRTVRGQDGLADASFVPHLAVTGAVALALVSVAFLIYFLHHASTSIQADQVIAAVGRDLDRGIDELFPERLGREEAPAPASPPQPGGEGAPVASRGTGYVTGIDGDRLLDVAAAAHVVIGLVRRPGEFVIAGETLAWVVPGSHVREGVEGAVARAVRVGPERTFIQDILFGIDQLVEIAVRALASGHTDPTTALRCIDRLGAAVARVSGRQLPSPYRRDKSGAVRVVAPTLTVADFVGSAFTAIRLQGEGSRAVSVHLLETFQRLAALRDHRKLHLALLAEGVKVRRGAARAFRDPADRDVVEQAFARLTEALRPDVRRTDDVQVAAR